MRMRATKKSARRARAKHWSEFPLSSQSRLLLSYAGRNSKSRTAQVRLLFKRLDPDNLIDTTAHLRGMTLSKLAREADRARRSENRAWISTADLFSAARRD